MLAEAEEIKLEAILHSGELPFGGSRLVLGCSSRGASMPATKSIFDEIDEEEEERAIAEAEQALAEGRVVPHEEVVKWLKSWGTPNELPRPKSK
jgi:predicted transcriptional regulator